MGRIIKRALKCLYGLTRAKIGCAGYNVCAHRVRVPTLLTISRHKIPCSASNPSVYAGVQRILSPLLGQNRGWGGSSLDFSFLVEPILPKEIFYESNLMRYGR